MSAAQRKRYLKATTLKANGKIFAEWNINRFSGGPVVKNHLVQTQPEDDYYSLSSVAEVDRPPKGIVKAMTFGPLRAQGAGLTSSILRDMSENSTSYVASMDDQYKYYLSPSKSGRFQSGNGGYPLTDAGVELTYLTSHPCNLIVVTFETGVSVPKKLAVSYRAGGSWTTVNVNQPSLDDDGRLMLWRQSDGSFSTNKYVSTNALSINGVRVEVQETELPNSFAAIIEVSPRLVVDITEYVTSVSADMEVSNDSKVAPLGVSSSNVASITLDNSDRYFSDDNPESPFYNMIGRGISFSLYVSPTGPDEIPTEADRVTVFENMVSTGTSKERGSVTLELKDPSRILQERKPPEFLIQNCSITEAVIRICHSVGFNDIKYDLDDIDPRDQFASIPFFWTEGDRTAWENISSLAEATQTAVYFDEFGKLQIKTRRAAFNLSNPVVWTLDADDVDAGMVSSFFRPEDEVGKKADIESLSISEEEVPNHVEVKYYETSPSKVVRGNPELVVAWEPEGDVVLRSARITHNLLVGAEYARFQPNDVQTWPHKGMFQVEGEVIEYDAKQYRWHRSDGTVASTFINSDEEKEKYDSQNVGMAWANAYTGNVRLSGRGKYFTKEVSHYVNGPSYTVSRKVTGQSAVNIYPQFARRPYEGYATLTNNHYGTISWGLAKANMTSGYQRIVSTQIEFPPNQSACAAGLAIGVGPQDSGIYVELAITPFTGSRQTYNELNVYWKDTNGVPTRYGGKGVEMLVTNEVKYQLDVKVNRDDTNHQLTIYVNGVPKMNVNIPRTRVSVLPAVNGVFFRGWGYARYGHLANIGSMWDGIWGNFDVPAVYDRVNGGYRSMLPDVVSKWAPYMAGSTGEWSYPGQLAAEAQTYASNFFFDEFGLIAHEVREFDITYEEAPMLHSSLYISNDGQVACPGFTATPFGANFVLVNTSRNNAVVNGSDTLTYGADGAVDQKLMVYGRLVKQEEAKSETIFNKVEAIREGKVELTIDNALIQTKSHANNLASWVALGDGGGSRSVTASIYANPHIQLGDLVSIHHSDENLNPVASRFFVVAKNMSYDGGLKLDLTLRSVV